MAAKYSYAEQWRQKMDDVVFCSDNAEDALHGLLIVCRKKKLIPTLAKASGITQATIYYIINEQRSCRIVTAEAILNALGYELKVVKK